MKYITIVLLLFMSCNLCPAQGKPKAKPVATDTAITPAKRIADIDAQIIRLNQEMKLKTWYDEFMQIQQNIAFLQGMKQSLSGIKDSTITIPRDK
jgi:hypothetical protein